MLWVDSHFQESAARVFFGCGNGEDLCGAMILEHKDLLTGRVFHVTASERETDTGKSRRFFLTEMCPSGQVRALDGSIYDDPLVLALEDCYGGNDFMAVAQASGVPVDRVILVTTGAQASAGFATLAEVSAAISNCIQTNRRFRGFEPMESRAVAAQ